MAVQAWTGQGRAGGLLLDLRTLLAPVPIPTPGRRDRTLSLFQILGRMNGPKQGQGQGWGEHDHDSMEEIDTIGLRFYRV